MKDEYDFSQGTRGAIFSTEGMTHIHLYVKDETLEELRKQAEQLGTGYQTLINGILKKHLASEDNISDLPLEPHSLNKNHPMWRTHRHTDEHLREPVKKGSREKYDAVLAKVPNVEPEDRDKQHNDD